MQLVYKFNYYGKEFNDLSLISNDLYNQALYQINLHYTNTGKFLRYELLEKLMKTLLNLEGDINYYKLKTQTSQQLLMLLCKNYKSFFKSEEKGKKPPQFRKKKSKNILIYTNQNSSIRDNIIKFSRDLHIKLPQDLNFTQYNQIRVIPKYNYYEIEIVYEKDIQNLDLDYEKYSSIDLGVKFIASLWTKNSTLLINGVDTKAINQFYNKVSAKNKSSNKDDTLNQIYRHNWMKDKLHKISRFIVNQLVKENIGNLVIGYNKEWKQGVKIGKRNNQNFVNIPHRRLIDMISYKCELVGIKVTLVNESYTSKCDGLAFEPLTTQVTYLGKRKFRGLFQSSVGKLINADINGCINILRKVAGDSLVRSMITDSKVLFNPICMNI